MLKVGLVVFLFAVVSFTHFSYASTWSGEAELGGVVTSGNTETQTINAKSRLVNDQRKWLHVGVAEALNSSNADRTTAERYLISAKSDYKFTDIRYGYVKVGFENDRFSGYNYQISQTVGYGQHIISEPILKLSLEGGPGARQSKRVGHGSVEELIMRFAGDFFWRINENAEFTEAVSKEYGQRATITKFVSGLKSQIIGSLAMKLSYAVKHTADDATNTVNTDTETAITLVYSF